MSKIAAVVMHELRDALPVSVFFLLTLLLGRATQVLLLEGYRVSAGSEAAAVVGAPIVAKAVLIADALPLTRLFARRALIVSVIRKALIYGAIALAFRYLEELVLLWRAAGEFTAALWRLLAGTPGRASGRSACG